MSRSRISRIAVIQALTVLVLLAPLVGAGLYVWARHQQAQTQLHALEPRYARLQGLLDRRADLQSLGEKVNEQLKRLAYPPDQDATKAGNDAQQRVRSLFAESALDVISIQVLPVKQEGGFDRIQISLRVEGDITGIRNALVKLSAQTPLMLLDNMTLQTIGAVRPASTPRLGGQFSLTVFRVRP